MRQDDFPHPVSDPAASGMPEYADDDSTADERAASAREADGPAPAALPAEREDGPMALDDFGTTPEEQRRGESLAGRLVREEPDTAPPPATPDLSDPQPMDPMTDSPVSTYERTGTDAVTDGRVGRLVQPDQGGREDTEAEEIAVDAGSSGGGASAEELALHEVRDEDLPD
jgi:hypothetical protein